LRQFALGRNMMFSPMEVVSRILLSV
jgi:hypothetical protein